MFAGSLFVVVSLLAQDLFAAAQTSNATCAVSHKWAFNSQKQTPCVVAATLLAVCTGSYEVAALPEQFHYDGPSTQDANPCQCNTVVYSLLAECGLCQSRTITMCVRFGCDVLDLTLALQVELMGDQLCFGFHRQFPQSTPRRAACPGMGLLGCEGGRHVQRDSGPGQCEHYRVNGHSPAE
ncbi:hypothetical protein C8R46DRAFT_143039 [Mycena filopes]|nr:hypothetical protein C8R46DRAFT_143039 [Mycena filopes]